MCKLDKELCTQYSKNNMKTTNNYSTILSIDINDKVFEFQSRSVIVTKFRKTKSAKAYSRLEVQYRMTWKECRSKNIGITEFTKNEEFLPYEKAIKIFMKAAHDSKNISFK